MTQEWRRWSEQYNDRRWIEKAREIRRRANQTCEMCGRPFDYSDPTLRPNVHHGYYHPGKALWEYDDETLWAVHQKCHEPIHAVLYEIWLRIATINPKDLRSVADAVYLATNDFAPRYTAEQIARVSAEITAEIREEEQMRFAEYTVDLTTSDELHSTHAPTLKTRIEGAFPGIDVELDEDPHSPDCMASVNGPDEDVRSAIETWINHQRTNW